MAIPLLWWITGGAKNSGVKETTMDSLCLQRSSPHGLHHYNKRSDLYKIQLRASSNNKHGYVKRVFRNIIHIRTGVVSITLL